MVIAITTEECVPARIAIEVVSTTFGVDEIVSITAVEVLRVISRMSVLAPVIVLIPVVEIVAANDGVISASCEEIVSQLPATNVVSLLVPIAMIDIG